MTSLRRTLREDLLILSKKHKNYLNLLSDNLINLGSGKGFWDAVNAFIQKNYFAVHVSNVFPIMNYLPTQKVTSYNFLPTT